MSGTSLHASQLKSYIPPGGTAPLYCINLSVGPVGSNRFVFLHSNNNVSILHEHVLVLVVMTRRSRSKIVRGSGFAFMLIAHER